jgi:competence protein ComEC
VTRGEAQFEVWHPAARAIAGSANAESLVLSLSVGGRRFVFPGDVGEAEERAALDAAGSTATDVLKAAHHGAAGSSGVTWLRRLRPRLAVISAGAGNPYGHPSGPALSRLRAHGVRLLRTDRDGEIAWIREDTGPWRLVLPGSPRRVAPRG